jgi:hypothetical protein
VVWGRIAAVVLATVAFVGCDSMELTIAAEPAPGGMLSISNANDAAWSDARLVVEAVESDGSTTICAEESMGRWQPGSAVTVPVCGDKLRITLTADGETARFTWANGQLFRKFGRKEVPVAE